MDTNVKELWKHESNRMAFYAACGWTSFALAIMAFLFHFMAGTSAHGFNTALLLASLGFGGGAGYGAYRYYTAQKSRANKLTVQKNSIVNTLEVAEEAVALGHKYDEETKKKIKITEKLNEKNDVLKIEDMASLAGIDTSQAAIIEEEHKEEDKTEEPAKAKEPKVSIMTKVKEKTKAIIGKIKEKIANLKAKIKTKLAERKAAKLKAKAEKPKPEPKKIEPKIEIEKVQTEHTAEPQRVTTRQRVNVREFLEKARNEGIGIKPSAPVAPEPIEIKYEPTIEKHSVIEPSRARLALEEARKDAILHIEEKPIVKEVIKEEPKLQEVEQPIIQEPIIQEESLATALDFEAQGGRDLEQQNVEQIQEEPEIVEPVEPQTIAEELVEIVEPKDKLGLVPGIGPKMTPKYNMPEPKMTPKRKLK